MSDEGSFSAYKLPALMRQILPSYCSKCIYHASEAKQNTLCVFW